jgi:hypothetical protein
MGAVGNLRVPKFFLGVSAGSSQPRDATSSHPTVQGD